MVTPHQTIAARYTLLEVLGRGGQAEVWRATDETLSREVALKILHGAADASWKSELRFFREAEVTARLNHPGICSVFEAGSDDGLAFIAMQLVEGASLSQRVREAREQKRTSVEVTGASDTSPSRDLDRAELEATLKFVEETARALHVAHEEGLVHRDIKPGNVMVGADGRPVLLDFGLARETAAATMTSTGEIMGTPAYMAPEQLEGRAVDRRTDIYALGVTLYECLTTRLPHERPTREALYRAILSEPPTPLRSHQRSVSDDLRIVVATAMEKEPDHRYRTALEFADDLARVRERKPIRARAVSPVVRVRRWAERNPVVAALLLLVIGTTSALAGVYAIKSAEVEERNLALVDRGRELTSAFDSVREQKDRVLSLKDTRELRLLLEGVDSLFPAHPDRIDRFEAWLDEATALLARLPEHQAHRASIEALAGPYTEEMRADDHPRATGRMAEIRAALSALQPEGAAEGDDLAEKRKRLEEELNGLRERTSERKTWGLDAQNAWLHELLVGHERLLERTRAEGGAIEEVTAWLERARRVRSKTVEEHAEAWGQAIRRISENERYAGLPLEPQVGLIPLGPDPTTGFEEFLHWFSHGEEASLPVRGDEGRFVIGAQDGIILVLLPGAETLIGVNRPSREGESGPRIDPQARDWETPAREVVIAPYFMGKYEVTRGQYERLTRGENPSQLRFPNLVGEDAPVKKTMPVEFVSWVACDRAANRTGLLLPTEAQWEYACRGGSTTIYLEGDDPATLQRFANVADRAHERYFGAQSVTVFDWSDGYPSVAPVGRLAANGFGLHDVIGNVFEWVRDVDGRHAEATFREGDGLAVRGEKRTRMMRGGSFRDGASSLRSAHRRFNSMDGRAYDLGFRVSAAIQR